VTILPPAVVPAIQNNAAWCDGVCRAHGIATEYTHALWSAASPPPRFYPDAITLIPDAPLSGLVRALGDRRPASVKDSFASLDLRPLGFEPLFDASWIFCSPDNEVPGRPHEDWSMVETLAELAEWEDAWSGGGALARVFPTALLDEHHIAFLRSRAGTTLKAGAVVSFAAGVYGISNVFATDDFDPWPSLVGHLRERFSRPYLCGYQSGDDLERAASAGFIRLRPLRIWVR
jgi:hypothetical protein